MCQFAQPPNKLVIPCYVSVCLGVAVVLDCFSNPVQFQVVPSNVGGKEICQMIIGSFVFPLLHRKAPINLKYNYEHAITTRLAGFYIACNCLPSTIRLQSMDKQRRWGQELYHASHAQVACQPHCYLSYPITWATCLVSVLAASAYITNRSLNQLCCWLATARLIHGVRSGIPSTSVVARSKSGMQ